MLSLIEPIINVDTFPLIPVTGAASPYLNIRSWKNRYRCSQMCSFAPVSQREKRLLYPKGVRYSELSSMRDMLVFTIGASSHDVFMVVTIVFRMA